MASPDTPRRTEEPGSTTASQADAVSGQPDVFRGVETVMTDLDDTLVSFKRCFVAYAKELMAGLARAADLPPDEIRKGFTHMYQEHGIFQYGDALGLHPQLAEKFPGRDLTETFAAEIKAADRAFTEASGGRPEDVAFLRAQKAAGRKLVLVTGGPAAMTLQKVRAAGLEGMFDRIVAAEVKPVPGVPDEKILHPSPDWDKVVQLPRRYKYDAEGFKKVFGALGMDIGTDGPKTAMFGDNPIQDIANAQKNGLKTVHITGYAGDDLAENEAFIKNILRPSAAQQKQYEAAKKAAAQAPPGVKIVEIRADASLSHVGDAAVLFGMEKTTARTTTGKPKRGRVSPPVAATTLQALKRGR